MTVNLRPTVCNICGGEVEYVELTKVYGNYLKYGKKSGYCYHCTKCGATVGTHEDRPLDAFGILADKKMCELRQKAHSLFDKLWRNHEERTKMYQKLADAMQIPVEECHFSYFSVEELEKSLIFLKKWWFEKYDI